MKSAFIKKQIITLDHDHQIYSISSSPIPSQVNYYYHHLNINNELRCGKCHSIPIILDNGKLQMKEKWQWLNNDLSEGESLLIEI